MSYKDILLFGKSKKEMDKQNVIIYDIKRIKSYSKLYPIFTQPLRSGRIWHKVNFYAEFNRFEFRVFPLLN